MTIDKNKLGYRPEPFNLSKDQLIDEALNEPVQLELLPEVVSNTIKAYKMNTGKFHNKLGEEDISNFLDTVRIDVGGKKGTTYVAARLDYDDEILQGRNLTPYDLIVHAGLYSLLFEGNNSITPAMLYRAINGITDDKIKVPASIEKEMEDSIRKMESITITMDVTDHVKQYAKGRGVDPNHVESYFYEERMLNIRRHYAKINGMRAFAYELLAEPILYKYAGKVNNIRSIPPELLAVPGNNNKNRTVIKEYILRRIESMKSSGKLSNVIRYDAIFHRLERTEGKDKLSDKVKRNAKEYTSKVLDYYKSVGYIKNYKIGKDGRQDTKVTITY